MKIPRDIGGQELVAALHRYGYRVTRQTGSPLRLTTRVNGEHHVTIPVHPALRVGTLSAILEEVSHHVKRTKSEMIQELWGS